MRKQLAILLALVIVLGMFAACGNGTQPSASSTAPTAEFAELPATAEDAPATSAESTVAPSAEEALWEPILDEPAEIVHLIEFPIDEPFTITVSESTTPSLTGSALIGDDGSELGWAK